MLVFTQSGQSLFDTDFVFIDYDSGCECPHVIYGIYKDLNIDLGYYSSEENAYKVLKYFYDDLNFRFRNSRNYIFRFPKDKDVI